MATTNDLKNGMVLNLDGLWAVNEFQHVKPGKGGAFVRTTLKNVLTGKVVDKTFNAGTKVEIATVDKRAMTYLYKEGDDYVFMDGDTFDQIHVPEQTLGDGRNYLLENMEATVAMHEGVPLYVELPASVELLVAHTDPGLQGDRSTGGTKPATLETGAEIQVPLFVTTGEKIKVDTRDGRYLGRVTDVLAWVPAARRASAPSTSSTRPTSAAPTRSATLRERLAQTRPAGARVRRRAGRGRRRAPRAHRRAARAPTPRTGRSSGCRRSTAPSLRIGAYELLWCDDVPDAVAVSEAVELVGSLSTDESPGFVNGMLGRLSRSSPAWPSTHRPPSRSSGSQRRPERLEDVGPTRQGPVLGRRRAAATSRAADRRRPDPTGPARRRRCCASRARRLGDRTPQPISCSVSAFGDVS